MENIPAGPKQGREETPVLNLECSDMWETCSPVMGDSHGGKKKKKAEILGQVSLGTSNTPRSIQTRSAQSLLPPCAIANSE